MASRRETEQANDSVQFEISATVLQDMLSENRLSIQKIHCLNSSSKEAIKRALLANLAKHI